MTTPKANSMTETELSALEARIKRGQKTFIQVGLALMEIQDSKAYKKLRDFRTFEAYVMATFGFSRQRAYQLIQSAEFAVEFKKLTGRELANSKEAEELGKQLRERPPEVVKTLL